MEEKDFKIILENQIIKEEYDSIKTIDETYFMIIKECFFKIRILEKYLHKQLIKGIFMLKSDNFFSAISNAFDEFTDAKYRETYMKMMHEVLNTLETLKMIKNYKKVTNNEGLNELKNYYLSMRFLTYYYQLIMYNYSVKVKELLNLNEGITAIIPLISGEDEGKKLVNKIKNYYEVKNGKSE